MGSIKNVKIRRFLHLRHQVYKAQIMGMIRYETLCRECQTVKTVSYLILKRSFNFQDDLYLYFFNNDKALDISLIMNKII